MSVSIYRITASSLPSLPVDSLIIDTGSESPRTWHLYSADTGDFTPGFAGRRVGRVCPSCWAVRHPGVLVHDGPHGPGVDHVQAQDDTPAGAL